ncbi:hypothetical protein SIN8267_03129 [Sinobacterium norvegicum]|uniref:SURF1-like protein n=1 Tax=Sinobacterium norvegicum TaxID=1641715 RepID=A0ABN8EKR2_9GAMM|nr:SURF1 family protein [Sinobacterium norvegicum]CAH0992990.1 hypothetical protein SIN8267_03129 [Sinobacterium norvegicum]
MLSAVAFKFHPNFWLSLLFVACFSALVYLGIWQLHRAEEKQQIIIAEANHQQSQRDISSAANVDIASGQRVLINGNFSPRINFLLDNQMYHRQFGYLLFTPFYNSDRSAVYMTVRGWLRGSLDRKILPEIPANNSVSVSGEAVSFTEKSFALADEQYAQQWPAVIQTKDFENFQQYFDMPLYPYLIWLDAAESGVEKFERIVINVAPEKHQAYALQWFSMAAVLLLLYLINSSNLIAYIKQQLPREQ